MTDHQKDTLVSWLKNAHAMEKSLIQNLKEKAKDADTAGELEAKTKIEEHLNATTGHAEDLETCLKRLGSDPADGKDLLAEAMGFLQGSMKSIYPDVIVRNTIESYAAEHAEIAVYETLIAAAQAGGDTETAETCARILKDEEEMAEWLKSQLPMVATTYVTDQID